jgi:hypothetical protein
MQVCVGQRHSSDKERWLRVLSIKWAPLEGRGGEGEFVWHLSVSNNQDQHTAAMLCIQPPPPLIHSLRTVSIRSGCIALFATTATVLMWQLPGATPPHLPADCKHGDCKLNRVQSVMSSLPPTIPGANIFRLSLVCMTKNLVTEWNRAHYFWGLFYQPRMMTMWTNRWNDWRDKQKYSEKTFPSTGLSTTNPTWSDPASKAGRRSGNPATNHLSYGIASMASYYKKLWEELIA